MAEQTSDKAPGGKPDEGGDLRGKLASRLAIAGLLVALLLGVLAFFDYLAAPPEESEEAEFPKPVPVAPKKQVSQPVTPSENLPEPPAPEKPATAEAPPAPPEVPPAPSAEPSGEARPAGGRTAAAPAVTKAPVKPVPEATSAPSNLVPPPAPVAAAPRPLPARPAEPAPVAPPTPAPQPATALHRLFSGFLLQAGVFTSVQRAEELHAKLTLNGVPSTLETRVQVGPFRTRQEAEAAQAKLRELGIQTVLVPPARR